MSTPAGLAAAPGLRIGEVARLVGTTPRTIRYYEEIGLLPAGAERAAGAHRLYGEADVQRLRDALALKELLGVSLDELRELLDAEEARGVLRAEWRHGSPDRRRRRQILDQSLVHVERQLQLLGRRRAEIERLEDDLRARRALVLARIAEG